MGMTHTLTPADDSFADALRAALPRDTIAAPDARYLEEPRGRYAEIGRAHV